MRYAVVTPARNEAANLGRLAAALAAQTMPPQIWIVVDNGSTDGTLELARELAERYDVGPRPDDPGRDVSRTWRADRPGTGGGNRSPCRRSPRHRRQRRCRHLVRARLLRASAGALRRRSRARNRERERLRVRAADLAAEARHGIHRVGSVTRLSLGLPPGCAALRTASGLGRDRRVQGERTRLAHDGVRGASVSPPPAAKANATEAPGGRAGTRASPPTTSTTGRGTSSFVRSGRLAEGPPLSR